MAGHDVLQRGDRLVGMLIGATFAANALFVIGGARPERAAALPAVEAQEVAPEADPGCDFDGNGYGDLVIGVTDEDLGTVRWAGAVQVLYGTAGGATADGNQWWDQDSPNMLGVPERDDRFGRTLECGDFDGDGFDDLAIGTTDEDLGAPVIEDPGVVQVLYGSAAGLTTDRNQWWDQGQPGILGGPEYRDRFGGSLAAGDFDGDGFDDLAIGVGGEDLGAPVIEGAGAAQVLYGSAAGLTSDRNQWWDQGQPGILGGPEHRDGFGAVLTSGDFDGDGFDDLAIGLPVEDLGAPVIEGAGAVQVLYGSSAGLTTDRNQWWDQGQPDILGRPERRDGFGGALTSGDFDGDGFDDLAIAAQFENVGTMHDTGAVQVLYGSEAGLAADRNQWWDQGHPGIPGSRLWLGRFGRALTSGDFDGDGFADLAIAVNEADIDAVDGSGAVLVMYGTELGLTANRTQGWHQDVPGVLGVSEHADAFGYRLASGDFDGDGFADLVVGVLAEDLGTGPEDAGAVQVIMGSMSGLTVDGNQWWSQSTPGVFGGAEQGDRFGNALA